MSDSLAFSVESVKEHMMVCSFIGLISGKSSGFNRIDLIHSSDRHVAVVVADKKFACIMPKTGAPVKSGLRFFLCRN